MAEHNIWLFWLPAIPSNWIFLHRIPHVCLVHFQARGLGKATKPDFSFSVFILSYSMFVLVVNVCLYCVGFSYFSIKPTDWLGRMSPKWPILCTPQPHHNRFTALFPGPPGWAGARREPLDFMVQGTINRGRHTDHLAGRHSIRTNQCPPPPSPIFFYRPDALPAAQPTVSSVYTET